MSPTARGSGPGQPRRPPSVPNAASASAIGTTPTSNTDGLRCRLSAIRGETPKGVLTQPLWLPAIIAPFSYTDTADFTEYTTVGSGEYAIPMGGDSNARKLREISELDTLTLWWDAPWLTSHGLDADAVENALYAILHSKRPVEALITLSLGPQIVAPELRMDVTFRTITRELRAGEADTRYFNVNIKEHRDPSTQRRGLGEGRKKGVHLPTTHPLRDTDTLNSLAMEFYGSYSHWRSIRDANGISHRFGASTVIVYNTRFQTGQRIKIPKPPKKK